MIKKTFLNLGESKVEKNIKSKIKDSDRQNLKFILFILLILSKNKLVWNLRFVFC